MSLTKEQKRQRIKTRVRKIAKGTLESPRLTVFRSNKEIYASLIDDVNSVTICSASSLDKDISAKKGTKIQQEVGERTVLDVLNARQSLLNAEIKFFNEQKNQEVIKAQILYLAGILTLEQIREG